MIEQDENAEHAGLVVSFAEDWSAYFFAASAPATGISEKIRLLIFAVFAAGGVMSEKGMTMEQNQLFLDHFCDAILSSLVG